MSNSEIKDYQVCVECRRKYIRIRKLLNQFDELDYDICPYCHNINGYSR